MRSIVGVLKTKSFAARARRWNMAAPYAARIFIRKLMPVAIVYVARNERCERESDRRYRDCRFTHPQIRKRLRVASVFAIKDDSFSFKRDSLARWYVSGFDSSGAPVWWYRKSINDGFLRHGIATTAESRFRGIVDTFSGANRRRLRPSDTAKYCFEEYPWTCTAPLLLLAPLARNTIVLLYDLRRELGKVLPFFFSPGAFSSFLRLFPVFATSIPFRISSPYSSR